MGGKKKLSLKQVDRMQSRKGKQEKKKEKTKEVREKRPSAIALPDLKDEKTIGELKKLRILTPYTMATRFNIRISVAKDYLEQLEERGVIKMVSGNHNLKIYKPMD